MSSHPIAPFSLSTAPTPRRSFFADGPLNDDHHPLLGARASAPFELQNPPRASREAGYTTSLHSKHSTVPIPMTPTTIKMASAGDRLKDEG